MSSFVEIPVFVVAMSDLAVKVQFYPDTDEESEEIWLPLSLIKDADELDNTDENGNSTIEVKKWFLLKNGVEYDHASGGIEDAYEQFMVDEDAHNGWGDR